MYISWQQRVLPFSTFDAFVEALEKLGSSYVLKVSPRHAAAVLLATALHGQRKAAGVWLRQQHAAAPQPASC